MKTVLAMGDIVASPQSGDVISFNPATGVCEIRRNKARMDMLMGFENGEADRIAGMFFDEEPDFWQALSLVSIFNGNVEFKILPRRSRTIEVLIEVKTS
jgi:hypothetical protein